MVAYRQYATALLLLTAACSVGPEIAAGEGDVVLAKLVTGESEVVISRSELDAIAAAGRTTITETAGAGGTRKLTFDPPLPAALVRDRSVVPVPITSAVAMGPLAQTDDLLEADTPQLFSLPGDATGIRAVLFLRDAEVRPAVKGAPDEGLILIEGDPRLRIRGVLPDCDSESPSTIEIQRLRDDHWTTEAELFCDLLGLRGF